MATENYFFTVLTYPGGITSEIQNALLRFCDNKFTDKYVIVKEYGKSGFNPHLNVVYKLPRELDVQNWTKNATRYFKNNCYAFVPKGPNLVKNKKCTSPENVIGGYLHKESKAEIIINKGFNIEEMRQLAEENRRKIKITLNNAHEIIYQYDIMADFRDKTNFIAVIAQMIRDGYKFHPVLQHINKVYDNFRLYYLDTYQVLEEKMFFSNAPMEDD